MVVVILPVVWWVGLLQFFKLRYCVCVDSTEGMPVLPDDLYLLTFLIAIAQVAGNVVQVWPVTGMTGSQYQQIPIQ